MNLEQTAYTYIKDNIQNLNWLPGYQIRETEIATVLEISRTPIRKAFDTLSAEGLVEKKANKGVFVAEEHFSKKDFQDRMDFVETLLIDYLMDLQRREVDFTREGLLKALEMMRQAINASHVEFLKGEKEFWYALLAYLDNGYERGLIARTFNQIVAQKGYVAKVLYDSRQDKYVHMSKMVDYLADNDYPYVRREIRILFNQLVLNVLQGSAEMFKNIN